MHMQKINFSKLIKYLPALLGWVLAAVLFAFAATMVITSAHAAESPVSASSQAAYSCTPHKTIFGFTWGWDCQVPRYTNTMTLETAPATIWCNERGASQECKTAARATLRVDGGALAGLGNARQFDLALHCTTTPHNPVADCEIAIKSGNEK